MDQIPRVRQLCAYRAARGSQSSAWITSWSCRGRKSPLAACHRRCAGAACPPHTPRGASSPTTQRRLCRGQGAGQGRPACRQQVLRRWVRQQPHTAACPRPGHWAEMRERKVWAGTEGEVQGGTCKPRRVFFARHQGRREALRAAAAVPVSGCD